jgi:signal transduction histidine kinase/response regulator RpfG family c-di-GMP phosphodiesterase
VSDTTFAANPETLERVLILAPTGGDAELSAQLLRENDVAATPVADYETLCREIENGAGAVIVTSEALTEPAVSAITTTLERQPAWSEIPFLLFTGSGDHSEVSAKAYDVLGARSHVTLVDRPIHVRTLVSATSSALRSRHRQYEIRRLLLDLQKHVERLSGLAEASLAIASAGSLQDVLKMITGQARKLLGSDVAITRVATDAERGQSISVASSSDRYEAWTPELTRTDVVDLRDVVERIEKPIRLQGRAAGATELLTALFGEQEIVHYPLCGLIAAPLIESDEKTIGFIAVSNKINGEFTASEEAVLVQLAQMASAVVQKARAYREAQEASRAKDDFLATLAHELRTPMTSILGWVQMLKGHDVDAADVETAIGMIESSTRIQATLVEDLLDVSRIIAGKLNIVPMATELAPLVENVATMFRQPCEENHLTLKTEIDSSPLSVWGDPTRLQQIVWNLLSNSMKFTPAGGTINVTLRRDGDTAVISVRDTGEGISEEFIPHVFERFRQADGGTRRAHGGLGLGLAIVRHLVGIHGGTIVVRSEGAGKGAEFDVRLPLSVVRLTPNDDESLITAALNNHKLLIVDDDASARNLLAEVLANFGAEVRTAGSVREALNVLTAFDAELVISDLHMPGEDGYALIGRLRDLQSRLGREIPAVALTGYGRPEDRMRALGSGFRHYVQKPVELVSLAKIAADLVGRQKWLAKQS